MKRIWIFLLMISVALLFAGCNSTVYDMYQLPKRSEEFTNLQTVMNKAMVGLEYSAPLSGENQQTVQMVDLDGDGVMEYLLFAKGSSEKPLHIFIFREENQNYYLMDRILCNGTAFEQVEYIQMNEQPGYEIVVGRQVSEQVLRSVSIYTMVENHIEQILTTNYSKFICNDFNNDKCSELLILRPGSSESDKGVCELYAVVDRKVARSAEVPMSAPSDKIKRIISGKLSDGYPAVFVASDVNGSAIVTDIYALVNNEFVNVALRNNMDTSVQTLRNYYVYADDIDEDGVLELPSLINMPMQKDSTGMENQHIIRWYCMQSDGSQVDKMFTYHNFVGGWYLQLDKDLAYRFTVSQKGNAYEFGICDESQTQIDKVLTIYALTGQKREELAVEANRFVVYRGESTVYAASLEAVSSLYDMSKQGVIDSFHLILQDWKTGET